MVADLNGIRFVTERYTCDGWWHDLLCVINSLVWVFQSQLFAHVDAVAVVGSAERVSEVRRLMDDGAELIRTLPLDCCKDQRTYSHWLRCCPEGGLIASLKYTLQMSTSPYVFPIVAMTTSL